MSAAQLDALENAQNFRRAFLGDRNAISIASAACPPLAALIREQVFRKFSVQTAGRNEEHT
jgi:hypothetical protein